MKKFFAIIFSFIIVLNLSACTALSPKEEIPSEAQYEVAIIGGGVSGLTCGYYIKDKDFIILEKSDTVGGRALSSNYRKFNYSKGAEHITQPYGPVLKLIKDLRLYPLEVPSPVNATYRNKKLLYGHDELALYLIENSTLESYKEFVSSIFKVYDNYYDVPDLKYNKVEAELDNKTAKQWFLDHGFSKVYVDTFNVHSREVFGASLNDISALSFISSVAGDFSREELNITNSDYFKDAKKSYETSTYFTFMNGLSSLTESIESRISRYIRKNANVIRVEQLGDFYKVVYEDASGKLKYITSQKVVFAIPAPEVIRIASNVLDEERLSLLKQVKFSSYATVALFSDEPIFEGAFNLNMPDGYFFTNLYDSTWVEKHYRRETDVKEYVTSVRIAPENMDEYEIDVMNEEKLMRKVYDDLERLIPGSSAKVNGYDLKRFPFAYPVMTPRAYKRLLELNTLNDGNLILSGDYMIYPSFEGAIESGFSAAEEIIEATINLDEVEPEVKTKK